MRNAVVPFASLGLILVVAGCSQEPVEPSSTTTNAGEASYLLSQEPEGAASVIQARESAKDGDDVVVAGRIGGGVNPWIEGRAAFTIVDDSLKACSDIPGDSCEKPWDYCCETHKLPTSTALIKVVDENGDLLKSDARQLLNVQELSRVVLRGKATRDADDNLTVLADGIYVKSQ